MLGPWAMRTILSSLILPLVLGEARAEPLTDQSWDGLSRFRAMAAGAIIPRTLDLSALGPDQALMIIAPERPLDPKPLLAFVADGGLLVLADDFGGAGEVFQALGWHRAPLGQLGGDQILSFRRNPALPLALPHQQHPLVQGLLAVVLNHPAVLRGHGQPMMTLSDPSLVVAAHGTLGQGLAVVLSDPSVFINVMLGFEGNSALAQRTIALALSRGRVQLLAGSFDVRGAYIPRGEGAAEQAMAVMKRINGALARVSSRPMSAILLWVMAVLVAGMVALMLLLELPWAGPVGPRSWLLPALRANEEAEDRLTRYVERPWEMNYLGVAAVLCEEFDILFFKEMARHHEGLAQALRGDSAEGVSREEVVRAWAEQYAPDRRGEGRRLDRLLVQIASLPRPTDAAARSAEGMCLSKREFMVLYGRLKAVLETMDLEEKYASRCYR